MPYDLRANIDLPGTSGDYGLNEHSTHNLIESEALALQDGRTPTYGLSNLDEARRPIRIDPSDNAYHGL